jgi:hypothetical protein
VNAKIQKRLAARKRKIEERLEGGYVNEADVPMLQGTSPCYELADRARGMVAGGIGMIHRLAKESGLTAAIDRRLHLLKLHMPYHESDHVLNIAYNALCGGTCLDDIELRRNDEVFLDALGAQRIPDPTTAGDFCRRFSGEHVLILQEAFDEARLRVWSRQPQEFFEEAVIDMDGTLVPTTGECKQGMDISYKGDWGYHPLAVTLANTGEPLRLINRSGNRPSHEGAYAAADDAVALCRNAGFRKIRLRGDTDFTQSEHLDRWSAEGVDFVFGVDAMPNLVEKADNLPETTWKTLQRPKRPNRSGKRRQKPDKVKEQIVVKRGYKNLRLLGEDIAEFVYRPTKCKRSYRMVVVRKRLEETRGTLFEGMNDRYFFYITNTELTAKGVVFDANDRCNQENLFAQLKGGVHSLKAPVDNLVSNWAYMVMASLAWSLKAWFALWVSESGPSRQKEKRKEEKRTVLRMEFKTFVNHFIAMPAQVVRTGRRLIIRLLSWNRWQPFFFRVYDALRC